MEVFFRKFLNVGLKAFFTSLERFIIPARFLNLIVDILDFFELGLELLNVVIPKAGFILLEVLYLSVVGILVKLVING